MSPKKPYIGEILVELGYIDKNTINNIMQCNDMEPNRIKLCEYLITKGFLSSNDYKIALEHKNKNGIDVATAVISLGFITESVFYGFFKKTFYSHKPIGQILIDKKVITKEQLEESLAIQKKYKTTTP